MLPIDAAPGSGFNPSRLHPITHKVQPHTGQDFPCPVGTPVHAVLPGKVEKTGFDPKREDGGTGAGRFLRLDHGLIDGHRITSRCYHLSAVLAESHVDAGEIVALSGNSGDSTGPHLHFEIRVDGTPVDPLTWLATHTTATPPAPEEDTMLVLIQPQRGHWLIAPGYAHQLNGEEWAESVGKIRDAGIVKTHEFEDGPVGQRRFDLAMAAFTHNAIAPAASTPGAIDYVALARAVNDDAARRMTA